MNLNSIGRLVFDECHQLFLSRDLRDRITKLVNLSRIPVQQVHLTATLPPHLVPNFIEGFSLTKDTKIVRRTTERPEIQYSVLKFEQSNELNIYNLTLAKVEELNKTFDKKSRGIIFSRSVDGCKIIKEQLDCAAYYAGMPEEELANNFKSWLDGDKPWIVATSGFTNGIDYPFVVAVLFMDPPYGMLDFVQGSGRGSRAGQVSTTILITSWKNRDATEDTSDIWKCTKDLMLWLKNDNKCRRHGISACMDGQVLTCKEIPNAQLCDVCSGTVSPLVTSKPTVSLPVRYASVGASQYSPTVSPAKASDVESNQFQSRAIANEHGQSKKKVTSQLLSRNIELFAKGNCIVCFTAKGKLVQHEFIDNRNMACKGGMPHVPQCGWISFKKTVRVPGKYAYCYHCWTPQSPNELQCHKISDYKDVNGCNLHNILCLFAWTVFHDPQMRQLAERKYGWPKSMTVLDYAQWCSTVQKSSDDSRFINVIHLFLFIYHHRTCNN